MNTRSAIRLVLVTALAGACGTAAAGGFYVSGSAGAVIRDDVRNEGTFTSNFTTGAVTGVTPPLTIPSGSDVGWRTEFSSGRMWSLAAGWRMPNLRLELEYHSAGNDVDTHRGVSAAGIDLTAIDAGVLISGNTGNLGVSVGDLVAVGRGKVETSTFLVNAYYDFDLGGALTPFVGAGLGTTSVDVLYRPSDVGVIDDSDSGFAYQFTAGAHYGFNEQFGVQLSASFVNGDDLAVDSSLLPARFEIRNRTLQFQLGLRYSF